jgi:hypothetical protein
MIKSLRLAQPRLDFAAALILGLAFLAGCRSAPLSSHWVFEPTARPIANTEAVAPQLLVLTSGTILATLVEEKAEHENELGFYSSSTDGDVFARTLQLNGENTDVHPHWEGTPRLLVGLPGAYSAFWIGSGDDHLPMELTYSRSNDFGHSFSTPSPLDAQSGGSHPYFNAGVTPDGTVLVVWIAYDRVEGAVPGSGVLQMIRSSDGGATFSAPQRVEINVCPCCRPEIKTDAKGNWYLAWRHVDPDQERDIVVAVSHDKGLTWSKETRVSRDGWHINGCPDSGPSLTFLGEKTLVAWHTVIDGEQRIFWAESNDGGQSFAARQDLGPSVHDPNHPYLINVGERVIAVFQGRDQNQQEGWSRTRVYFRQIAPDADPKLTILPLGNGSATYPIGAALGPREIMVAWTDVAESGSRALSVRGRFK